MKFNINRLLLCAKHYAPDILTGTGVVGVIGGTIWACVQTTKLDDATVESRHDIEYCKAKRPIYEDNDDIRGYNKDLTKCYANLAKDCVKLYIGPAAVTIAGLTCIVSSHHIMKNRNAALTAAYTALDGSYKAYRQRVIDDQGEEADKKYRYGFKREEVNEVNEETGEVETKVYDNVVSDDPTAISPYARFFDELSRNWERDAENNYNFLRIVQIKANNELEQQGYLLLNTVYNWLDIPETRLGATHGWIKDPDKINKVDFGLTDVTRRGVREFVNGYERSILLDFNCDGDILHFLSDEPIEMERLRGATLDRIHILNRGGRNR